MDMQFNKSRSKQLLLILSVAVVSITVRLSTSNIANAEDNETSIHNMNLHAIEEELHEETQGWQRVRHRSLG